MAKYDLNLRDYWRTIRKRRFIIVFTIVSMGLFSLLWAILGQPDPIYKTSVSIKIEKTGSLTGLYAQAFSWSAANYLETQASVMKSYVILETVAKKLNLIPANLSSEQIRSNGEYLKTILDLKSKVETEQEGNTDIINVNVTSEDPRFAQRFANTIAQVYKEEHLLDINRRTFEAKKFIENQLNIVKEKVSKSEDAVRNYRENSKLISLDVQSATLLAQASKLQASYDQDIALFHKIIEVENVLATAENTPLTSKTSFYFEDAPPIYKNLNDRLVQIMLERDTLLLTYTENLPQIQEIKKQTHEIITSMKAQLSSRRKSLDTNIKNLQQQIKNMDEQLRKLPEKGLELVRLEREAGVNREVHTLLEKKYQEALIQDAEKIEEIKIVKPAFEPTTPINPPKTAANTFVGTIIGLIMGIVFAFIMETFDTSIGAIEEVEEFLGVRVLGIIPQVTNDEIRSTLQEKYPGTIDDEAVRKTTRLIAHFLPISTSAENYRALRTNLNFLNLDKSIKTIVFTSSSPEEGKTTVSVNLALTMAQGGNKVLLIEGDLRRPVIARLFGIEPLPGLTDVILGNYEWRTVVRTITDYITGKMSMDEVMQTPGMDNLHIITGGTTAPQTAELVSSKIVHDLIRQATSEYDIVLIDSPPILAATDAAIWSSLGDGTIIVYQVGRIARGALKRAKAQLDNIGARILGVVLNGLKAEISPDFAYHDRYYYYGDNKIRKPSLKDKIISVPEIVKDYLRTFLSRTSHKQAATESESGQKEFTQQQDIQKEKIKKEPGNIGGLKIGILLFAFLFLILGILYQTGFIQFNDLKIIAPDYEVKKSPALKEPSTESIQTPSAAITTPTKPPKEATTTQVSVIKATNDWGVILYAKEKTNIRAQREINSKTLDKLEPGQKIRADFLRDGWYAVFNLKETLRDEKRALGYVYASLLYPPESVKEQVGSEIHKTYALQIKAVNNLEEAKNIVETLKRKGLDAHWTSVNIQGRGIWYRIFVGKFSKKEEAFKFLDEKKIRDSYPDCMVKHMYINDTH